MIANAIQFPRVLVILYAVNAALARAGLTVLLSMTAAGLLLGLALSRWAGRQEETGPLKLGNPFRLLPALKFGLIFAAVVLLSDAATTELGGGAVYWTSALGGSVDVDAVSVSLAGLLDDGAVPLATALGSILLALVMNALLKTALAAYVGGAAFGWRVGAGFGVMFGAGALVWIVMGGL